MIPCNEGRNIASTRCNPCPYEYDCETCKEEMERASYLGKARASLEKLKQCAENDHCEEKDCMYYLPPGDLLELVEWVELLFAEEEEAEVPE